MLPTPVTGCMVASCFRVLFIVTGYAYTKFLLHLKMLLNTGVQLAVDCVMVVLVLDCKFFCSGVCLIVVVVVEL